MVLRKTLFSSFCVNISKLFETCKVTSNDQQEVAYALLIGTKVDELALL